MNINYYSLPILGGKGFSCVSIAQVDTLTAAFNAITLHHIEWRMVVLTRDYVMPHYDNNNRYDLLSTYYVSESALLNTYF